MNNQDLFELVANWRWFQFVPEEGQRWLAQRLVLKKHTRGEALYAQGEAVSHVYAVVSGSFKTYMLSPLGEETTLEEIAPGGWFPYFVPGDTPTYLSACMCVDTGIVATVPLSVVREFGELWPRFYEGLYTEIADRLGVIIGRIQLLSLYSVEVRLAVYILRMINLRGRHTEGGSIFISAMGSQSEIGARIGGTRQRINTVLSSWSKVGVLSVQNPGVVVHDREYLYSIIRESGFEIDAYLDNWQGGWLGAD